MTLNERIVDLCVKKNISQSQLERDLGIAKGSVTKWKTQEPRSSTLKKVADYFQTSTEFLLTGVDSPTTHKGNNISHSMGSEKSNSFSPFVSFFSGLSPIYDDSFYDDDLSDYDTYLNKILEDISVDMNDYSHTPQDRYIFALALRNITKPPFLTRLRLKDSAIPPIDDDKITYTLYDRKDIFHNSSFEQITRSREVTVSIHEFKLELLRTRIMVYLDAVSRTLPLDQLNILYEKSIAFTYESNCTEKINKVLEKTSHRLSPIVLEVFGREALDK